MTGPGRRWIPAVAIAAILVLVTWVRIGVVDRLADQGWLLTYVGLADRIVAGEKVQASDVSPVYLGAMVLLRSAGAEVQTVRAIQIAMLTLSAFFCAFAAWRLAGWTAAAATAVLILGNRAALVVCSELDPKALIFFVTSAALALLVWLRTSDAEGSRRFPRTGVAIAAGICAGIAAAAHPYGYLLLLVMLAWGRSWGMALAAALPIVAVLVFSPVETHSGTQFYEGNNALATGCGGVMPRVVGELQTRFRQTSPDPVYRFIAERAGGDPKRYWRDQALAFLRESPGVALRRFGAKALLTVHHFDVYDVVTAQRRGVQLARYPAIPFGVAFVFACCAVALHTRRRDLLPLVSFALAIAVMLTIFVVSARQRNVLLVPLAILGGAGVAELVRLGRNRIEHGLAAFGAVLIAVALLGVETGRMREYDHMWRRALRLPVDPEGPAALFDRAVELERGGRWREAEAILATIEDYRPLRQTAAVSSVAYYRARAAIALGRPEREFLERAAAEAPGDPDVLALRAARGDDRASRLLEKLHDPLTRARARRHAFGTGGGGGSSGAGR